MTSISGSLARRVQPQKDRSREQSKRGLPARAQKRCLSPSKMLTPAPTQYLAVVDQQVDTWKARLPVNSRLPIPDLSTALHGPDAGILNIIMVKAGSWVTTQAR